MDYSSMDESPQFEIIKMAHRRDYVCTSCARTVGRDEIIERDDGTQVCRNCAE